MLTHLDLASIREQLAGRSPVRSERPDITRRAAVAMILRPTTGADSGAQPGAIDTEVLLIRRAERSGDPWSGHMALPGGHQEPVDVDLQATAVRETQEEVGIDLREHEYLGQLDEVPAVARGHFVGMIIAPYVFALRSNPKFTTSDAEVAELLWASLGQMARGEIDDIKELHFDGELRKLPAFRMQDHVVWGLTYIMLRSLFVILGARDSE